MASSAHNTGAISYTFDSNWPHHLHGGGALRASREGIERFLIPCTCVGLQPAPGQQSPVLHAPNGLEDLYAGLLRPNPLCPHLPLFRVKAQSYRDRWHWLAIQEPAATAE